MFFSYETFFFRFVFRSVSYIFNVGYEFIENVLKLLCFLDDASEESIKRYVVDFKSKHEFVLMFFVFVFPMEIDEFSANYL